MPKRGSNIQQADHIAIPLLNGSAGLAQVALATERAVLLFLTAKPAPHKGQIAPLRAADVVSILPVTRAGLGDTQWPILGYDALPRAVPIDPAALDQDLHDPALVEAFVNALHGLYPWDAFPDPKIFNALLRPDQDGGQLTPSTARLTSQM
ncbi:hypothetical protein [Pseudooctadecabacter jejudonensis]|uniref:Uncharacterized protein n=1 Tax=Pseudooctadecabacter jejudonensis TaxID=1391910 RepID=A0A1Y5RH22_9RHOB|nr:hypothetical protein [Pseudooctadecabacter jejudonensis]SLN17218.1 hypothetical protein PSJ8397_00521 [Pseudooctadecabacter jejudonensis]